MVIRRNIPGIMATGYEGGRLQVILSGHHRIEFMSDVPESVHNALLSSPDPLRFLEEMKKKYSYSDLGCTLG
nr:MAG TPA: KTSC domain [Caudoviricetes sp.]